MAYVALVAAIVSAVLKCALGNYIYSAAATLLCALAVGASGDVPAKIPLVAGLVISIAADWFLAHQGKGENRFLYGVMGFFAAHCLFLLYALGRFTYGMPALAFSITLLIAYAIYLWVRILPHVEVNLRVPVVLYAMISIFSLYFALSMNAPMLEKILYVAGIAAILISDTMISEGDFAGNKAADKLLLPAYYLCHVLISLSAIIRL